MCDSLNKDGRFQICLGPAIDMSGLFLTEECYDFLMLIHMATVWYRPRFQSFLRTFLLERRPQNGCLRGGALSILHWCCLRKLWKEETLVSQERTVAVKVWPTRPREQQQQPQQTQRQQVQQPPLNLGLPPPHAGPPPPFPPLPHGWGDFGHSGHGPITQFPPPGVPRGRGMCPGEHPPPPRPDNWRPPPGRY